MQTMDNLLMQDKISIIDYLERIPEGYISNRAELLDKLRAQAAMPVPTAPATTTAPQAGGAITQQQEIPIPTGGGYSALQRAVNETGMTQ